MNEKYLIRKTDVSSTKAFETQSYKIHNAASGQKIDWASQVFIKNQTQTISDNNYLKKANITIHKNVKWW